MLVIMVEAGSQRSKQKHVKLLEVSAQKGHVHFCCILLVKQVTRPVGFKAGKIDSTSRWGKLRSHRKRHGYWEETNWGHFCTQSTTIRTRLCRDTLVRFSLGVAPTNQTYSLQTALPLELGEGESFLAIEERSLRLDRLAMDIGFYLKGYKTRHRCKFLWFPKFAHVQ